MASIKIIIVSDKIASGMAEDRSGAIAEEILLSRGHRICGKKVIPNNQEELVREVLETSRQCDGALVIGGTGPSPRDISVDVVERLSWRFFPGFGEVFRLKTYEQLGVPAIFTRAALFMVGKSAVAVVPGAPDAVRLGASLYAEAVQHIVEEYERRGSEKHRRP